MLVAGCGGQPQVEPPPGRISLDGAEHTAESVDCTQDQWKLRIQATAGPAQARAFLGLEGDGPTVENVAIYSADGFNGTAGGGVGTVEATAADGTYTITGTAEGFDPANPAEPRSANFRIDAPC
jgi:hypothetical protein